MRVLLAILVALTILSSCHPKQYLAGKVVQRDSVERVRIEYKEVLRDTTIYVPVPAEAKAVETLDTTSVLETSVAKSIAKVSGGVLSHKLENKPVKLPAAAQIKDVEIVRDTVTIIRQAETVTVIEEVQKLYWWQTTLCYLGAATAALILLYIAYRLYRLKL